MSTVKLQAREIHRAAKRHKIRMKGGSYSTCAFAAIGAMVGYVWGTDHRRTWDGDGFLNEIIRRTGRPRGDLKALESGYENSRFKNDPYGSPYHPEIHKENRYFKVGERLAKLAENR